MDKHWGNKVFKPKSAAEKKLGSSYNSRRGGSSTIPASAIIRYSEHINLINEERNRKKENNLIASVKAFGSEILNDPVLRMNYNSHILQKLPEYTHSDGKKYRMLGNTL